MNTTYIITGNNYACAAMDLSTLVERVSAQFRNLPILKQVIDAIRQWAESTPAGSQMEIAGFIVTSKERK